MSRIRRCVESRCHEPVQGRASRCAKHQQAHAARLDENHRNFLQAADMLHDRRLPEGDSARAMAVAPEFAQLVRCWDKTRALRRHIDDLPVKVMEPLAIAQHHLLDRCVWRAQRLRQYVVEQAFDSGSDDETARIGDELKALTVRVTQATLEDRRRRGWPA